MCCSWISEHKQDEQQNAFLWKAEFSVVLLHSIYILFIGRWRCDNSQIGGAGGFQKLVGDTQLTILDYGCKQGRNLSD